jgi:hypothetical protein
MNKLNILLDKSDKYLRDLHTGDIIKNVFGFTVEKEPKPDSLLIENRFNGIINDFEQKNVSGYCGVILESLDTNFPGLRLFSRIRMSELSYIMEHHGIKPGRNIGELVLTKLGKNYIPVYTTFSINKKKPITTFDYGKIYENDHNSFIYLGRLVEARKIISCHYSYSNDFEKCFQSWYLPIELNKSKTAYVEKTNVMQNVPKVEDLKQFFVDLKIKLLNQNKMQTYKAGVLDEIINGTIVE